MIVLSINTTNSLINQSVMMYYHSFNDTQKDAYNRHSKTVLMFSLFQFIFGYSITFYVILVH
jgi:hypothetical protein